MKPYHDRIGQLLTPNCRVLIDERLLAKVEILNAYKSLLSYWREDGQRGQDQGVYDNDRLTRIPPAR